MIEIEYCKSPVRRVGFKDQGPSAIEVAIAKEELQCPWCGATDLDGFDIQTGILQAEYMITDAVCWCPCGFSF